MFTGFWLGGLNVRDHWEDLGIGGRITFKLDLREIQWGELDLGGSR
jgi:hypothetical protein